MTDHPGSAPSADDPDPAADADRPSEVAPSSRPPADGTPPDPLAAAFEGPAWDTGRRRRRSSSGDAAASEASSSSDRRSSDRRSSEDSSSVGSSGDSSSVGSSGDSSSDGSSRDSPSGGSSRRRSRGNRRLRHTRSVVVHVVLGLLGLGLAWVVVTGLLAAYQLQQARSDLTALRAGISSGNGDLDRTAKDLAAHAHHADVLTQGPAWALAARVPYLGEPLAAVRGVTRQTSQLVDTAAPGLVAVADEVNPRNVVKAGKVDLTAVRAAAPAVQTAAAAARNARAGVENLPRSTWLSPVDDATATLRDQLGELTGTLDTADQALQVLPTMLGGDGATKRYFVAFQNNAELRGTGGLPGAFAIVTATDGQVSIERFESDSVLGGVIPTGLDFGAAFDQHYSADLAYTQYVNSNLSPHFPYAAQLWCAMWRQVSGQQLDGALTVDPGALSYLLAATGPAAGPDGQTVTADNVVALLQKDVYAQFPEKGENDDRKQYILDVASAVEKKILSGTGNSRALLTGFARGVTERRILAWSSDPTAEEVLAGAPIGGAVPTTTQPFSQLVVNNGAGGKLDYYLGRAVTVRRDGCGDTRDVTVTIRLTNNAPTSGLPPYVTDRIGFAPPADFVPGQNRTVVDYLATTGAQLVSATLDGAEAGAGLFDEQGHPSFETIMEIKPGQTRTWVLTLTEPAGTQPVTVVKQPGVLPVDVAVDDHSCS